MHPSSQSAATQSPSVPSRGTDITGTLEAGPSRPSEESVVKPRPKPRRKQATKVPTPSVPEEAQWDPSNSSHTPMDSVAERRRGGRVREPAEDAVPTRKRKAVQRELESKDAPIATDDPPVETENANTEGPSTGVHQCDATPETVEERHVPPRSVDEHVASSTGRGRRRGRGRGRGRGKSTASRLESTPARKSARLASKSNIDGV